MKKVFYIHISLILMLSVSPLSAESIPVCSGNNDLLNLVDRPSVAFSACTAAENNLLIESGYVYQQRIPEGYSHSLPQMELRYGLTSRTELDIFPPNYFWTSSSNQSGLGVSSIGLKHLAYFDAHQIISVQGLLTAPSGNRFFGTRKTGLMLNGVYNYNFDSGFGISTVLGLSSLSDAPVEGGQSYFSLNPIIVMSWSLQDQISSYIEFYSQSKTASNQGWGLSADAGLIVLLTQNMTVDFSMGQRLSGALNSVKRYVAGGFVIRMG